MVHKKREKKKAVVEKNRSNLYFFICLGIFLIIAFFILAPTKTYHYEVEVSYTDTETYTVKEPYETQESYQVQEPYETTETYTDKVPVQEEVPYQNLEYYYDTVIKDDCNTDAGCSCTDWGGFLWMTCVKCSCKKSHYVTRYKTETVYRDIEKERPVTKYKTMTKYRTVTKYRDIEKTREVVKTKMEARQVEQNWLFGFKMPYRLHIPYISD